MLGDVTSLGAVALLVALGAANAVVSLALLRWRDADETDADRPAAEAEPEAVTDDASVRCPRCGEANEPDYAFCRACVSRLPGDNGVPGGTVPTADRV